MTQWNTKKKDWNNKNDEFNKITIKSNNIWLRRYMYEGRSVISIESNIKDFDLITFRIVTFRDGKWTFLFYISQIHFIDDKV